MKRFAQLTQAVIAVLFVVTAGIATAQTPIKERAQFRGGALDATRGFLAAYDRNQVWVYDLATATKQAEINVGHGPADVALAGNTLGVVNRLDNSVSLINLATLQVSNTVKVGEGPVVIKAVGDKQFAVANSFSDSVSVIDAASGGVQEIKEVPSVPSLLAVSGSHLAVAGKASANVRILEIDGAGKTVALPGTPSSLGVLQDGSFSIGIDAVAYRLDTNGKLGEKVSNITSTTPPASPTLVVAGPGHALELHPVERTASIVVITQPAVASSKPAETVPAAVQPAVVKPAPQPAPAPTTIAAVAPTQVVEAQPAEAPAPPAPAPSASPAPAAAEIKIAAPSAEPVPPIVEAASSAGENTGKRKDDAANMAAGAMVGGYRENPIQTEGVRAPSPGPHPTINPLDRIQRKRIGEALAQPTQFGLAQPGFIRPNYGEALRDVQADQMTQELDSDVTHMQGNVRLKMGDMNFSADKFDYTQQGGNFEAEGNVLVTQVDSKLEADHLKYTLPPREDMKLKVEKDIFKASDDVQSIEDQRMQQGHLTATNLYIEEPTRALRAATVDYDFGTSAGVLTNAKGRADIWYFKADTLRLLGPASASGDEVWVTTCDHDPPHYRIRMKTAEFQDQNKMKARDAQLYLGNTPTPFFLPRYGTGVGGAGWSMDFDTGSRRNLGFYTNLGEHFEVSPEVTLGPREWFTAKDGVGLGFDMQYDFTGKPASRLYMNSGELHTLYNTNERGYIHYYNRWEANDDLVVRLQVEQWGDRDFYRDYYYHEYRNRTEPRSFGAVTYRQDGYIAEGVVQPNTHSWERETERLPEAAFYLLERPIADRLYVSFETVNGYNDRQPAGGAGIRSVNSARLSYDINIGTYLNILPFFDVQDTWYGDRRFADGSGNRLSPTAGVNLQTRLQRTYGGALGFSGFKHIIVPSVTYSYRPDANLSIEETPRYDALDNAFGFSRLETKLDNLVYGKDAKTGEVWQVARLTLYHGADFWNEISTSADYEAEIDIRPRPWWGYELAAERHEINGSFDLTTRNGLRNYALQQAQSIFNRPFDPLRDPDFDVRYGDYNRILTQLYYDNTPIGGRWNARLGYAYTSTQGNTFNREVLYGLGVRLNDNWSVAFEQRYDFDDKRFRQQVYEVRRRLHCWEAGLLYRQRESGYDINFTFNIAAFPGSKFKI